MGDLRKPVFGGHALRPPLDRRTRDFDRASTLTTNEVVVMLTGGAGTVGGFTVVGAQHVDLTVSGHRLQVAIHRREADTCTRSQQGCVDLLGGSELG